MSIEFTNFITKIESWRDNNIRSELGQPTAGILIPVITLEDDPGLLLTVRSKKLKKHPGQISFPGGKVDPEDNNVEDTVLRETFEEIGVKKQNISLITKFHDFSTPWFNCVTPIVGVLKKNGPYVPSYDELDEILEVPLKELLNPKIYHTEHWVRGGLSVKVHFYNWTDKSTGKNHNIWGATAGIIHRLFFDLGLLNDLY